MMEHYKNLSLEDIEGEVWKDIPGYEGYYQVSSLGRFKIERPSKYKKEPVVKIMKQNMAFDGYLKIALTKNGSSIQFPSHRLVALSFFGQSELKVDHLNEIKYDNRPENLEYVSTRENTARYYARRRELPTGVVRTKGGKYMVQFTIGSKNYNLGTYSCVNDAKDVYIKAANDVENIDKYAKVKKPNKWGYGVQKERDKFRVTFTKNRQRINLGLFSDLEEAKRVGFRYYVSFIGPKLSIL